MFTQNAHGQVTESPFLGEKKKVEVTSEVFAALSACTVLVTGVPGAALACFHPNAPHYTKQGSASCATPQSCEALAGVSLLITVKEGKHTLPSGMTLIYTAFCKLFPCKDKDKQKILCMKCLVVQDKYTDIYIYIYTLSELKLL